LLVDSVLFFTIVLCVLVVPTRINLTQKERRPDVYLDPDLGKIYKYLDKASIIVSKKKQPWTTTEKLNDWVNTTKKKSQLWRI